MIHVHRDIVLNSEHKRITKEMPKTFTSDRYVELPPGVADLVRKQGYVTKFNPNSLTNAHRRFLEKCGVPFSRFHDWRHFMVSSLNEIGCSDAFIQKYGGWSSDYTMKNVYRHTLSDHDAAMAHKATDAISALMQVNI